MLMNWKGHIYLIALLVEGMSVGGRWFVMVRLVSGVET